MAAYRQNVPLRETAEIYTIEDGTMCRMPSPRPGPLRGEADDRLPELASDVYGSSSLNSVSAVVTNGGAQQTFGRKAA